jgi:hypothetical protein
MNDDQQQQPQSPQLDGWVRVERAIMVFGGLVFVVFAFYLLTFAVGRFLWIAVLLFILGAGSVWFSRQEALIRAQLVGIQPRRQLAIGVMVLIFGIIRLALLDWANIDPIALMIGVLLLLLGVWSLWRGLMAARLTSKA